MRRRSRRSATGRSTGSCPTSPSACRTSNAARTTCGPSTPTQSAVRGGRMLLMRQLLLIALSLSACVATGDPSRQSPSAGDVDLFYASYQMDAEPHYRLIFEGGTDVVRPSEVRIAMPSGATVASAPTVPVPSASEPMLLCGATKTSEARLYGPLRATLAMPDQQVFKDFIREPIAFRVEAKVADAWRATRLTLLCHAIQ